MEATVKLPNAMTYGELLAEGKSDDDAKRIMDERVFGKNVTYDKKGAPVERGKGSALQPTSHHVEALRKAEEAKAIRMPNNADVIAAAVAAGVQAGLAQSREEKF